MASETRRAFRKNFFGTGTVKFIGQEYPITVQNLSTTGALVQFQEHFKSEDKLAMVKLLTPSATVDLHLDELAIAGQAAVSRVEINNNDICLALCFGNMQIAKL
jgi:hypothetical protein